MKTFVAVFVGVLSLLLPGLARAQGPSSGEPEFQLPADPSVWVNSGPITIEALKGKAAFLWFYEEGCPSCRKKWPQMQEFAKQYEDKPIVFIAVNSGNPRPAVEQYLKSVNVKWPTIVDSSRQLEKAAGVNEISLQNIHQAMTITPDGQLTQASWSEPGTSVDRVLADAKWMVPPAEVPAQLKPAWLSIEFNQFAIAGPIIKKALTSPKAEIKDAATKLNDAVQAKIEAEIALAEESVTAGDKWKAFKAFKQINTQFAGFTLPDTVLARGKELVADETVKKELAASKALEAAKRSLQSTSKTSLRSGTIRLKKLAAEHAGTEAATEAEQLLAQIGEAS